MKLKDFMHGLASINPASIKPASKTPSFKKLNMDKTNIYKIFEIQQSQITVYKNGYVTYSKKVDKKMRKTVFHINKIKFSYRFVDGTKSKIDVSQFGDVEEVNLLACYGEIRLAHNQYSRGGSHTEYHLDNDGNDWTKETFTDADIVEKEAMHCTAQEIYEQNLKKLENAQSKLTDKQREVIQKKYYEKKKPTDIAKELGIDRKTAREHHDAALKKMKKYF